MSLLFIDGFDHYATADIEQKWPTISGSPVINPTGGRRSGGGLELSASGDQVERTLAGSYATLMVGAAVKVSSLASATDFLYLLDGTSTQIKIRIRTDGALEAYRDATLLGTSATTPITAGTTYYIETKVLIANAGGTVTLRVNGTEVLALTGQDTQNTANAYVTGVRFNCDAALTVTIDDVYIADDTGSAPQNDLLGDVRVDTTMPSAEGTHTDLAPSSGADNAAMINEATPDGDTSYVSSSAVGAADSYVFDPLTDIGGSTIYGVQLTAVARKESTGTRKIRALARVGSTDYNGSSQDLEATYTAHMEIWEQNPDTAAAWAEAEVNAAELGAEVAS